MYRNLQLTIENTVIKPSHSQDKNIRFQLEKITNIDLIGLCIALY